jgi:GT2 family glycosyltransferase
MSLTRAPATVSVVIVTLNEGSNLRTTVESYRRTLPEGSEIVVVDDGSDDGSTGFLTENNGSVRLIRTDHKGVARGRNLGARNTTGDAIVFSDAHVEMPDGWAPRLLEALSDPTAGGAAPAIADVNSPESKGCGLRLSGPDPREEWMYPSGDQPFQAPLLPWCSTAMRRDVFEATGGFDEGMVRWGQIDNEMSLRLWLLGYELWAVPQVKVLHVFRSKRPYVCEWSWPIHNKLRLSFVHFDSDRVSRVAGALREHHAFPAAMGLLAAGDVSVRRAELLARRVHDAEWFFEKFGPDW